MKLRSSTLLTVAKERRRKMTSKRQSKKQTREWERDAKHEVLGKAPSRKQPPLLVAFRLRKAMTSPKEG
jgi:hypothetical protein